jgi:hypothetical protein
VHACRYGFVTDGKHTSFAEFEKVGFADVAHAHLVVCCCQPIQMMTASLAQNLQGADNEISVKISAPLRCDGKGPSVKLVLYYIMVSASHKPVHMKKHSSGACRPTTIRISPFPCTLL